MPNVNVFPTILPVYTSSVVVVIVKLNVLLLGAVLCPPLETLPRTILVAIVTIRWKGNLLDECLSSESIHVIRSQNFPKRTFFTL